MAGKTKSLGTVWQQRRREREADGTATNTESMDLLLMNSGDGRDMH